jgi:hypothetical protein
LPLKKRFDLIGYQVCVHLFSERKDAERENSLTKKPEVPHGFKKKPEVLHGFKKGIISVDIQMDLRQIIEKLAAVVMRRRIYFLESLDRKRDYFYALISSTAPA